jgi:metallo-beta-lactamase family protein
LGDTRTDVLFVGYQAEGTPGRAIQTYGPDGGYVILDGQLYDIKAQIHTLSGYSAHADQRNLVNFIKRMRHLPETIYLVHGDTDAKVALQTELQKLSEGMEIVIP